MRALDLCAITGIVLLTFLAGCGKKSTYSTPEGDVTVQRMGDEVTVTAESDSGRVEVRSDEFSATITTEQGAAEIEVGQEIDPEQIGIPLYPGAEVAASMQLSETDGGEGEQTQVHLTTPDSFADVAAFYKEELPEAEVSAEIATPEIKMLQLRWEEDGYTESVVVSRDASDKQTRILLQRMSQYQEE